MQKSWLQTLSKAKAEKREEESVEETVKSRIEKARRLREKRGVARQPVVIVVTQEGSMGAATIARRFLDHIFTIRRSAEGIQEETEDPFLQRSLEIDENIRSGKNRPLSKEEGQRFFDKIMRS